MSNEDIAKALRIVAERMAARPWTTGIEQAFQELAEELERRGRNLDPEPYLLQNGERVGEGARTFYAVRFDPRPEYEQEESAYE